MDSVDLLARENEFKKLNKQLEKKTETLMKEIENAMQKQDIFSEFSKNLTLDIYKEDNPKRHCCSAFNKTPASTTYAQNNTETKNTQSLIKAQTKIPNMHKPELTKHKVSVDVDTDCAFGKVCACLVSQKLDSNYEFLQAFISVNVKEDVLPKSFAKEGVSVESICKYLSSKIKLLEEQITKLQCTINKKGDQCERHMKTLAEFESERLSLMNRANSLAAETADMKAKYQAASNRYNEKDKLYKEQRSEFDKTTSEVKRLRSKNASLEAKCAHHEHHIESLSQQLQAAVKSEKELRDASRSLATEHTNAISVLEMRIKNLTSKVDKQNALIDNLKKQNALLLTDGALKALEGKYCSFLRDYN